MTRGNSAPDRIDTDRLIRVTVALMHDIRDRCDEMRIQFSGGKDSTILLECGRIMAAERGEPLVVNHFDIEFMTPDTRDYVERVKRRPNLDFRHHCIPLRFPNAFSRRHPYWYAWDPAFRDVWHVRPPDDALFRFPGFRPGMGLLETAKRSRDVAAPKTVIDCIGIRRSESPARRMLHFETNPVVPNGSAFPIYIWSDKAQWRAIRERGWDFSREYYRKWQMRFHPRHLRVGPPFGEEPSATLHAVCELYPDLWNSMLRRIPEAEAIARYANTAVMGRNTRKDGDATIRKDDLNRMLGQFPPEKLKRTRNSMLNAMKVAFEMRSRVPVSQIASMAVRGDSMANRRYRGIALRVFGTASEQYRPVRNGKIRQRGIAYSLRLAKGDKGDKGVESA